MTTLRPQYPLAILCRVLDVSRSGYYAWRTRRPSKRAQENARLEVAIQAAHVRTRQTYGPERLQAELRDDGFPAGVGRIKRLRKKFREVDKEFSHIETLYGVGYKYNEPNVAAA